ncbi:hypothetical protein [Streptomyces sp. RB13]|uniref:hypothetical protein n=1 Tax=Streptomyces sp. RB13 TaxID=2950978 RepID=UPI002FCA21EB|nr:hypothetical protein OHA15_33555 [Streptomyces anthocyanicus]
MTTTTAAERVAALRDEYARLGENVDHLTDLDLLNQYAERAERDRINTNDRYMRLLTEQRHYGDTVRAATNQTLRERIDMIAVEAAERHIREAGRLVSALEMLPPQPQPEHIARLRDVAASVKHMLRLLEEDRGDWRRDNHYNLVQRARSVVGVLRDKSGVTSADVIRLVDEALTGDGNLHDLFDVAHATPVKRQRPAFADADWAEMGGGSYWAFEPAGSRYRVVAYSQGDAWWIDLQGPTGALIAAGETTEGEVALLAAALIKQAPALAASGLRPWQCWQRATAPTTSAAPVVDLHQETPMDQLNLFPLSALQTEGYAQPEPRNTDDGTVVEAAVDIEDAA